jgi:hypothetical protein
MISVQLNIALAIILCIIFISSGCNPVNNMYKMFAIIFIVNILAGSNGYGSNNLFSNKDDNVEVMIHGKQGDQMTSVRKNGTIIL